MRNKIALSLLACCLCSLLQGAEPKPSALLFKSGFEPGTRIESDPAGPRPGEDDLLLGLDASTGFDWSRHLPAKKASFAYLVGDENSAHRADFGHVALVEITGHDGQPSTALYMECTKKAINDQSYPNRVDWTLLDATHPQLYTRYWLKLSADLIDTMVRDEAHSWRIFFESKEKKIKGKGYRFNLSINRKRDGSFYWHVRGEANGPENYRTGLWAIFNDQVPVPVGQWAKIEVFYRQGPAPNGVVWLAVNGQQVALHRGLNQHPDGARPLQYLSLLKIYQDLAKHAPARQWVDDLEIWSAPPADATPFDESLAGYSTFIPATALGAAKNDLLVAKLRPVQP
jgi:hypothetical protein